MNIHRLLYSIKLAKFASIQQVVLKSLCVQLSVLILAASLSPILEHTTVGFVSVTVQFTINLEE